MGDPAAANLPCQIKVANDLSKNLKNYDALCIIDREEPQFLTSFFSELRSLDKGFDSQVSCFKVPNVSIPVIYAPVDDLTDYHDVRAYHEAAARAVDRAVKAGFENPALLVPTNKKFAFAEMCSILGALDKLYVPIQLREDVPTKGQRLKSISFGSDKTDNTSISKLVQEAIKIESGRYVARDIGVGDPERMAPVRVEQYIKNKFPDLKIDVISDVKVLQKDFPLFAAVDRAAQAVSRHQGRIIFLEYKPPKPATRTLMLVGKGVTYDTGGADIKAGGIMAGMSRDKCGAAAVAGFMQMVQTLKPSNVHVIAAMCMVRNSVGEECYVADEVITSRAGVRVRVGNTDAEGRMCMTDALCRMKEMAQDLPDPHLFTIATLTGHACLAVGEGYSIVIDNSVAREAGNAEALQKIGDKVGEPFEISVLRKDDFAFNGAQVLGEDVVQCNNAASSRTPRGHQIPAAFMITASGLDKHEFSSKKPIKYTHLDIAASCGEYPNMPTGAPILALASMHLN